MKTNVVGWFEIPVIDMDRAKKFYEQVFKFEINVMDFNGTIMGWFPSAGETAYGATGCLMQNDHYKPSHNGTLVYFGTADVQNELNQMSKAGGKVLQEKTMISADHGFMAVFEDSEGNRIALHSKV